MDCSLPGSSIHGILQARILEWVTISFSRNMKHIIYMLIYIYILRQQEKNKKNRVKEKKKLLRNKKINNTSPQHCKKANVGIEVYKGNKKYYLRKKSQCCSSS